MKSVSGFGLGVGVVIGVSAAHAQTYYRIVDLGEPTGGGECGDFDIRIVRALGLNSKGQVVGEDICIKGGNPDSARGFYWLPEAEYGLIKDRATALPTSLSDGAARDINLNGIVVGWTGPAASPGPSSRAIAWNLASGIAQTLLPAQTIQAYGVNNSFQVVGVAENAGLSIGFFWPPAPPGNPATDIITLPSSAIDNYYAYDVANVQPGQTHARVAGSEADVPDGPGKECFADLGEAVAWYGSGGTFPITVLLDQPFVSPIVPGEPIEGEARGVNDLGEFVGAGVEAVGVTPYECLQRALYWENVNDLATSVIPPCALGDDFPPVVSIGWLALEEATDITRVEVNGCESDWVVGFGQRVTEDSPLTVRTRAFVLLSTVCPLDTNCDGIINVNDWVRVTQDYGPCGEGKLCLGDVNIDCVVNQADFDLLRLSWGQLSECATQSASAPPEVDLATELFIAIPTPEMAQVGAAIIEQGEP